MTRAIVYSSALIVVIAALAMTLTSVARPNWVSYHVDVPPTSTSAVISRSLGLHKSCTSTASETICRSFPSESDCGGNNKSNNGEGSFCAMWRTVGWLMSVATILELVSLVGTVVILSGGKARREAGWRVLAGLLVVVGLVLFAGMALVAYLFDNHSRFAVPGWQLDSSWILCTVSGAVAVLTAVGVAVSAYVLPPEDGYEFLA